MVFDYFITVDINIKSRKMNIYFENTSFIFDE